MSFAYRLDFGFWNPNAAGAFFVVLVFAVFLLPGHSKQARAIKGIFALAFFIAVLLTASRAALLGLVVGGLASWFLTGRPLPLKNWPIWVLGFILLLSCAIFGSKSLRRISEISASEPSTASRLEIYSTIPAMLLAAPGGWGHGNATQAYENWFQDHRDTTGFKNLLSTHGTWAVERGMVFLVFYVAAWCLALWICTSLAFGALACWGVCAALSHVGVFWWMWAVPALVVLSSLWRHRNNGTLPRFRRLIFLLVVTFLTLAATFPLALSKSPARPIHFSGGVLTWGDDPQALWFVAPDPAVFGKSQGKSLVQLKSFAVVENWNNVPQEATVVLSGIAPPIPPQDARVAHLHWLSPPPDLSQELLDLIKNSPKKTVWNGSERRDVPPPSWRPWFETLPGASWHHLLGRPAFLGDDLRSLTKLSH